MIEVRVVLQIAAENSDPDRPFLQFRAAALQGLLHHELEKAPAPAAVPQQRVRKQPFHLLTDFGGVLPVHDV
jgi:hypothetical protein